ncbi:hypothetical protein HWQ46_04170 [Shewanella sp. D64]|uniref:hypothetical protein n=1 Tax=unclassified Shewanella TaxID=196818 RepID=UPI0022BA1A51|nr:MULTISPECIES: hypothetical protein [unclassified Shewanella]MEC4724743.1 hypothetical protein [Shewanella sp. D64]MEC4736463.1 hypothetical protein [Shewanella sp. E94]WBJ97481.1 hypothetical protein HWQ47_10545 [Shewanella sp. MTB7]
MQSRFNKASIVSGILAVCSPLLFVSSASATTPMKPAAQQIVPAQLYPPADASYDWIQLTSFELLKGEIKNLYDDKLEFKSDELDTLYIDWEDIKVLQSTAKYWHRQCWFYRLKHQNR